MASYNVYLDSNNYSHGYDLFNEHIPSGTAFAARPDELCISLDEEKNISYNIVISNLTNNTITPLDKQIIGLIASFGYVTTKQLSEMLALLGCDKPADKLLNNTERLRRLGVIRAFSFGRSRDEKCCMQVFTLCKNGSEIAKATCVNHSYNIMNAAAYPSDVKRVLARNQGVLAFLKSELPLDWFRINTVISSSDISDAAVRPSFTVSVENEVIMYEVVRRGQFWENQLRNKLSRYKLLFDNFESNSWDMTCFPTLVMVGETFEHSRMINEIAREIGIKVLFSDDLMFCGKNFYSSVYGFENGTQQFYLFESRPRIEE
ncbi:MAG: hypothetical protein K6C68_12830 [Ruminococcus sp.]|nr:hypothetical protein [Ruminococcus sp.]